MAIEIQTQAVQNSILQQGNTQQKSILKNDTIQDSILGTNKKDDEKNDKEKDKITLSPAAQAFLNNTNTSNDNEKATGFSQDSLERQSLAFRGLAQIALRRDLNDNEKSQLNDIRANFAEAGIGTDSGILKLAQKKLSEIQAEAPELVQLLNSNEITGGQFKKLNSINQLLNNSNGFGSEQVEGALQVQTDQLTKQFEEIASQSENQKLSRERLNNLQTIQNQISQIQGFRLNVKDTVGPDGVVI